MSTKEFYHAPGAPEDVSADYIVTATAFAGQVRAVAARTTLVAKEALRIHQTSPVATAALGRFLTGSLLLAENLKNPQDTQTVSLKCQGPLKGMMAVCDAQGRVRGYCNEPVVENTFHRPGKLDVGTAVGSGVLTVIRDLGLKEPYVGTVELISGEIAEDFTYYLAVSEQIPSLMSLGVLVDRDGVLCSGGFLIQVLPGASDATVSYLEQRAEGGFPDITYLLQENLRPEEILDMFLGDPEITFLKGRQVSYACNCSRDRMEQNLLTLGREDLKELAEDQKGIDLECHFCDTIYHFNQEQVQKLLDNI